MNKLILFLCLFIASQSCLEGVQLSEPQIIESISYYGEISKTTGRPKTKYVKGYYRKDGTYVDGYYRS